MNTAHEMARLLGQFNEAMQRVSQGRLNPASLRRALQGALEPTQTESKVGPVWHQSPERWLETVARLNELAGGDFVDADLPESPRYYTPATPGSMLGLGMWLPDKDGVSGLIRTINLYWGNLPLPEGWTRQSFIEVAQSHLGLIAGLDYTPGIRWFEYDPYALWNPVEGFDVDKVRQWEAIEELATVEPLMMLHGLEPYRNGIDGVNTPFPDMPGLEYGSNKPRSCAPCVYRRPDLRRFGLRAHLSGGRGRGWASPRVSGVQQAA